MATLEKAILIAAQAHEGQRDQSGAPYILHPLRMINCVEKDFRKRFYRPFCWRL